MKFILGAAVGFSARGWVTSCIKVWAFVHDVVKNHVFIIR